MPGFSSSTSRRAAGEGGVEVALPARDQRLQTLQAFGFFLVRNLVFHLGGRGAGARRIHEGVGAGKADFLHQAERGAEVGFPGETEADFRATLSLVEDVGFAGAYSFMYSARPGTPAAEMEDQVADEEKAERLQRLQALITRGQRAFNAAFAGRTPRRAAGKAGQAAWATGRQIPIFAGGAGDGAARAHRFARPRHRHRNRQQHPVRGARRGAATHRSRSIDKPLRTPDPPIPPAAASEETATTQTVLAFEDNRLASILFGQYGQNLALIERRLGVVAEQRGNHVTIDGSRGACEQARRVLEGLYEQIKRSHDLSQGDVEGAIRQAIAQGSLFDYDPAGARPVFEEINLRKRPVRARTPAQDAYIRALKRHPLVFGTGPAGTGKTWLAVAHAVQMFERKEVDRIILSRPAVEAGERLGFLPGDLREKVDPYLRPVYDALYDLMDARIVERALQAGEFEIAPLAFMRGRTLSNAAVILDEAQNATSMQMKMFLTRLGENSRMIVTGDPSQVDLPPGQTSGLSEAVKLLEGIEGVGHVAFTHEDVIRHELVARIVEAYDRVSGAREQGMNTPAIDVAHRRRRCGTPNRNREATVRGAIAAAARLTAGAPAGEIDRAACRRRGGARTQPRLARHRSADQRAVVSGRRPVPRSAATSPSPTRRWRARARPAASRFCIISPILRCMAFCICWATITWPIPTPKRWSNWSAMCLPELPSPTLTARMKRAMPDRDA